MPIQVRLSVEDRRVEREITMWSGWKGCEGKCGKGKQEYRTRECKCPAGKNCYPCPVPIDEYVHDENGEATGQTQDKQAATLIKTEHRDCGYA